MVEIFSSSAEKKKGWILFFVFIVVLLFVLRRDKFYTPILIAISIFFSFKYNLELKINKILKLFLFYWLYSFIITLLNFYISPQYFDVNNVFGQFFNKYSIIIVTCILVSLNKGNNDYYFILFRRFGLGLCVLGLIEFVIHKSLFYSITTVSNKDWQINVFGTPDFRIFTMFLHPIVYGMFLVILYWVVQNYPMKNNYLNKIYLVLIIVNLFATQSRSAWVPFVITNILDLLIRKGTIKKHLTLKKPIRGYIFFCIACIVIFVFRQQLTDAINAIIIRFNLVLDPESIDGSRTQRLGAIQNIILFIKENNFSALVGRGLGYGIFFTNTHQINAGFDTVDNQYVTCMFESGVIGILFLFVILFTLLLNIKKYYISKTNKVAVMSILTIYMSIFFYEGFNWFSTLYLLTYFIAIIDIDNNPVQIPLKH